MSTVTVTSASSASPTSVYTGIKKVVRLKNTDSAIKLYLRDPSVNSAATWVDLPPGEDHVFIRANVPGNIVAYGSSAGASLLVNEMG